MQPTTPRDEPADHPNEPIRAVVFDMGGVLLDWDPRHLYRKVFDDDAAVERFLDDLSLIDWHVANHDSGLRAMAETTVELGRRHPEYAREIAIWGDRYTEMIGGTVEGTVEILSELRGTVPLYLLSNAPAEPIAQLRAEWPFFDWFNGLVFSGEERLAKPDPRLFELLLDRFGLEAPTTVFVDDVERNVAAAVELGLRAIRFESAAQLRHDLQRLGLL